MVRIETIRHDGPVTKTQYYTATSVDGFIADSDNSLDWLFEVPRDGGSGYEAFTEFFAGVGSMAMGATTYEWVVAHEKLVERPERWHEFYGDTPTWVFAHRELTAVPGLDLRVVQGDVGPVHAAMVEAAGGKNVWLVGGGELVGSFADAGLLDEIWLGMQPVFLGAGAPLLPRRLTSKRVELESARKDGQQVLLVYSVR
jgi:dihydrofolate reductase